MLTQEPTETRQIAQQPRWPRAAVAFAATIVIVCAAVGIWAFTGGDGGPVAAGDARIAVTFTEEGTSYAGHRQVIEGAAEISLFNETAMGVTLAVLYFEPGSAELAAELAVVAEGESTQPGDRLPFGFIAFAESYQPGSHDVALSLEPGSYILDVFYDESDPDYTVWRPVVLDVVAAD